MENVEDVSEYAIDIVVNLVHFETSNIIILPSIYAIILHNANQVILRHNVTQKMNGIIKIEVITIILTYFDQEFNIM